MIDGRNPAVWAREKADALANLPNVRFLTRTSVWGYYDGNVLTAVEHVSDYKPNRTKGMPRQRHWVIRAGKVILATGAFERPIVFPGNDCPGVMLADAVRRYAVEYSVAAGNNVTLFTNNDSAYDAARTLSIAGVNVIADNRCSLRRIRHVQGYRECSRRRTAPRSCRYGDPCGQDAEFDLGTAFQRRDWPRFRRASRNQDRLSWCFGWLVARHPPCKSGRRQA